MPTGWIKGNCLWVRPAKEASGAVFVVQNRLGKAVQRNRLKRRLRTICRRLPPSDNLVVFCQPPAMKAPFCDLQEELERLANQLRSRA